MRKIKDVLRLKLDAKISHEQIAGSLGLSKGVVTKYVGLAAAAGLTWPEIQACNDVALERRLLVAPERPRTQVQPDYGRVHHELRRKGMMLMLLWEEYQADHADSHTLSGRIGYFSTPQGISLIFKPLVKTSPKADVSKMNCASPLSLFHLKMEC